jgi:polysaccharide biosynthesis protein PslH
MERDRVRRYESVLKSYDLSLVCSEVDKRELERSVPGARVEILENGVDLEYFAPRQGSVPRTNSVIFTGNMSYFPNEDGVRYFVREILPLIRREVPDVQFSIVGQHPPKSVLCLADEFNVKVTGAVEDIRTYYVQNAVAVSPVRFGAGTLNKVLEPMAMGIPVVSSGVGMEGLPMKADEHFLMASDAEQFAAAVVLLLRDKQRGDAMAGRAMHLVRSRYGWEVITNRLTHYYEEARELHRSSQQAARSTSAR